jgi:hypothetical protein
MGWVRALAVIGGELMGTDERSKWGLPGALSSRELGS